MLKIKDLEEFRSLLEAERDKILELSKNSMESEISVSKDRAADEIDQAAQELNQNLTFRLRDRDRKLLSKIQKAILAIEEGTYGECGLCGEPISRKRLLARPVSLLCIECKEKQERTEKAYIGA